VLCARTVHGVGRNALGTMRHSLSATRTRPPRVPPRPGLCGTGVGTVAAFDAAGVRAEPGRRRPPSAAALPHPPAQPPAVGRLPRRVGEAQRVAGQDGEQAGCVAYLERGAVRGAQDEQVPGAVEVPVRVQREVWDQQVPALQPVDLPHVAERAEPPEPLRRTRLRARGRPRSGRKREAGSASAARRRPRVVKRWTESLSAKTAATVSPRSAISVDPATTATSRCSGAMAAEKKLRRTRLRRRP